MLVSRSTQLIGAVACKYLSSAIRRPFKKIDYLKDTPKLKFPDLKGTEMRVAPYHPDPELTPEEQDKKNKETLDREEKSFMEQYKGSSFSLDPNVLRDKKNLHEGDLYLGRVHNDEFIKQGKPFHHYFIKGIPEVGVVMARRGVLSAYIGHRLGLGDHMLKEMLFKPFSEKQSDAISMRQWVRGQLLTEVISTLSEAQKQELIQIDQKPFAGYPKEEIPFSRWRSLSCFRYGLLGDMDGTGDNVLCTAGSVKALGIFSFDHEHALAGEDVRELVNQIRMLKTPIKIGEPLIGTPLWMREQVRKVGYEKWVSYQYSDEGKGRNRGLAFPVLRQKIYTEKSPLELAEEPISRHFLEKIDQNKDWIYAMAESFQIESYKKLVHDHGQTDPSKCTIGFGQFLAIVKVVLENKELSLTEGECLSGCYKLWEKLGFKDK